MKVSLGFRNLMAHLLKRRELMMKIWKVRMTAAAVNLNGSSSCETEEGANLNKGQEGNEGV